MSRITDSIRVINSSLRTLLALAIALVVGGLGWMGYSAYTGPGRQLHEAQAELDEARRLLEDRDAQIQRQSQQITELAQDIEEKKRQIAQLETSLRLLKVDHRIAELRVLKQQNNPETGRLVSTIQFVEINDDGAPIDAAKEFTIQGDLVYIEAKVVQFEDRYVEEADPDRSTSLCLFQRLWGEFQEPHEGFAIDEVGSRPTAYARGGELSEFERSIWQNFWDIANDPNLAGELGVRTIQIEAPGMKVRPGNTYRVMLRASGGLTIRLVNQVGGGQAPTPDA